MNSATLRRVVPALLLLVLPIIPMRAQTTVRGTVLEDSSGRAMAGAVVVLEGSGQTTQTGPAGRFELLGVNPGNHTIAIRMIGYRPIRAQVSVETGDSTVFNARLVRLGVQQLDSVTVTGRPSMRGVGMGREAVEERMSRGFGRYIEPEELRRSEHRRVSDILRGMSGVNIIRFRECLVPVNRQCSPTEERASSGRGVKSMIPALGRDDYCWMSIMLDGRPIYLSGSSMKVPDLSRDIRVSDLDIIEVYRSASETPGEFSGAAAACGVILLWTKQAP